MKNFVLTLLLVMIVGACSNDDPGAPNDTFDRRAMLVELADSYIMPEYASAALNASALRGAIESFCTDPTQSTLDAARAALMEAMAQWQRVNTFDFGPAENLFGDLSTEVATFPTNPSAIEQKISAGTWSMTGLDRDARGWNAVDYLLYASNSSGDASILRAFSGEQGSQRAAYLIDVAKKIEAEIRQVSTAWSSGYRDDFVQRNGTDAGSGTSDLVNNLAMSFEHIKNDKIGIPAGLRAGQSRPEPQRVEAYYSGRSMELARRQFEAVREIWEGRPAGSTAPAFRSLRSYLETVPGGQRLVEETRIQCDAVQRAFDATGDSSLAALCQASDPRIEALHTELQKLTRFFKSELSSLLGIAITYSSGDGD
jgi:uncharacterized protein